MAGPGWRGVPAEFSRADPQALKGYAYVLGGSNDEAADSSTTHS